MAIRQTAGSEGGVVSGYGGHGSVDDFHLEPCGIEDVDVSIFEMFDSEINFHVTAQDGTLVKATVIFAAGERFAMVKRRRPIRDKNGVLILPLIAIRRTGIKQSAEDITGRGINQHTGELVIKRRLAPEDRQYQQLVNKIGIRNQTNIAIEDEWEGEGTTQVMTERNGSQDRRDYTLLDGAVLDPRIGNNIYEFITIPQPQFYTASYEIVFNTQYMTQLNELMMRLMGAFLPQGRTLRLETKKGYWFIANFGDELQMQDTFDDFTQADRVIMSSISCDVLAYTIPGSLPGEPSPIRKYVSAPQISFGIYDKFRDEMPDRFRNADDPTSDFLLTEEPMAIPRKQIQQERFETRENPFTGREERVRVLQTDEDIGESVFKQI